MGLSSEPINFNAYLTLSKSNYTDTLIARLKELLNNSPKPIFYISEDGNPTGYLVSHTKRQELVLASSFSLTILYPIFNLSPGPNEATL